MARKRGHVDLRGLDPDSQEFWNEVLRRKDLQMARGRSDRLSYVGDSNKLNVIQGARETETGRVTPKGEGPE